MSRGDAFCDCEGGQDRIFNVVALHSLCRIFKYIYEQPRTHISIQNREIVIAEHNVVYTTIMLYVYSKVHSACNKSKAQLETIYECARIVSICGCEVWWVLR